MAPVLAQEAASAGQAITASEVDAALAEILAASKYAPVEPPILYRWIGAALRWIGELVSPVLRRLMPEVDFTSPAWETFGWALLGLGALLGVALVGYLILLLVRAIRRRRRSARIAAAADIPPATAEDWEARARAAAGREEWRVAAMALYQAVLLRLSVAGALTLDRAKTPGDYRRELRRQDGDLAGRFEGFVRWFERIAYGAAAPGPDQYGRLTESAVGLGSRG